MKVGRLLFFIGFALILPGLAVAGSLFIPERVVVDNETAGRVAVVDDKTGSVVGVIGKTSGQPDPFFGQQPLATALSPDGRRLFISTGSQLFVADPTTRQVIARSFPGSGDNVGLAVSPDGTRVYVAGRFDTGGQSSVISVVDANTLGVIQSIPVSSRIGEGSLAGVALSPDGRTLVIPIEGSVSPRVVDTATNTVRGAVPTGAIAAFNAGVAISPDSRFAYVPGCADGQCRNGLVSVVDLERLAVVATVPLSGAGPMAVVLSPDGKLAFVGGLAVVETSPGQFAVTRGPIHIIDTASNTVVGTLPTLADGRRLFISSDGSHLFASDGSNITVLNVGGVGQRPISVPTLSEWGLIVLTMLLLTMGAFRLRRKNRAAGGLTKT